MDQLTYKKPTKIQPNTQNNNKISLIQKPEVVNLENSDNDYDIDQFKDMSINLNYDQSLELNEAAYEELGIEYTFSTQPKKYQSQPKTFTYDANDKVSLTFQKSKRILQKSFDNESQPVKPIKNTQTEQHKKEVSSE